MSKIRNEVKKLRPIDDIFFEKIVEDKNVCEETGGQQKIPSALKKSMVF